MGTKDKGRRKWAGLSGVLCDAASVAFFCFLYIVFIREV